MQRRDIPAKVTGGEAYVQDMRLPGMVFGRVVRPPSYGAQLTDCDTAAVEKLADATDGFEIARRDLQIRGPGEFMGARQSGAALLRFADLATDTELLADKRAKGPAPKKRVARRRS